MEYQVLEPLLLYPDKMARFVRISSEKGLEGTPLKPHHIPFIIAIGNGGGISQKELCARIPVDKSRVSTVVHELMLMGLAYNGSGGKTWSLELTDAGREAFLNVEKMISSMCDEVFGFLSKEELDAFLSTAAKVESRIEDRMGSRASKRFRGLAQRSHVRCTSIYRLYTMKVWPTRIQWLWNKSLIKTSIHASAG